MLENEDDDHFAFKAWRTVIYDPENIEINRFDRNLDHAKIAVGILLLSNSILIIIGTNSGSQTVKKRHYK